MKRRIKLVHFIHGLSMGGAETLVKEYALGLNKNKFDLTILCLRRLDSSYEKILKEQGVHIIYVSDFMLFYKRKNIFFRIINKLQRYYFVRKILRKLRPDVIHVHLNLNQMVLWAKLPKTTKIFYTQHSDFNAYQKKYKQDVLALKKLIGRHPTKIIALNEDMRKQLNQFFGISDTVILNNGINLLRFKQAKTKEQIRRELGILQNAFVLGHIGRLNAVKNQTFLIDIASAMLKENPNTFLLIIGSGPDYAMIENKLQETKMKERSLILSNRTDIPDLLAAMDRFVFPSIKEGIPLSLIEAQVSALPCIISSEVSQYAKISDLVTFKSLREPISSWVEAILAKPPAQISINLRDWDIEEIIKKLEILYEQ